MGETPKQYEQVHEFTGQDLLDDAKDFFDDVVTSVRALIREGNNCRVRVVNKDGEEKFSTTVTVGTAGFALALLLAPMVTILVGIGTLFTEHSIIVEKEVVAEQPAPKGTNTSGS